MKGLGHASLSGARCDTVIGISSVTNKQTNNFLAKGLFNTLTAKEIKGISDVNLYFKPDFLLYEQILHFCAYFVVGRKHW